MRYGSQFLIPIMAAMMVLLPLGEAVAQEAPRAGMRQGGTPVAAPYGQTPAAGGQNQGYNPTPGIPAPQNVSGLPQQGQGTAPPLPVPQPAGGAQLGIDDGSADRALRQAKGNFDPLPRGIGIPMGQTQDAWSHPLSSKGDGQVAPGVIRFAWSPELVMPVRVREQFVTQVILPKWEKIDNVLLGDNYYWEGVKVRDNIVTFRSSQTGIDSSATVLGSTGNIYVFYLRSEPYNTKILTDLTVFVDAPPSASTASRFGSLSPDMVGMTVYGRGANGAGSPPAAGPAGDDRARREDPPLAPPIERSGKSGVTDNACQAGMVFLQAYEVHDGDGVIAPELACTDGTWTYFDYGSIDDTYGKPEIFKLEGGIARRINTRALGSRAQVLVAETTGEFVLKKGQKTVCVKFLDHPPAIATMVGSNQ